MADSPLTGADGTVEVSVTSGGSVVSDDIVVLSITTRAVAGAPAEATLVIANGSLSEETFEVSERSTFVPGTLIGVAAGYSRGIPRRAIFEGRVVSQRVVVSPTETRLEVNCRAGSPEPAIPTTPPEPGLTVALAIDLISADMSMAAPKLERFPSARGTLRFAGSGSAKVGTGVEVRGLGRRFEGRYAIRAVTHTLAEGEWLTEVSVGDEGAHSSGGTAISATSPT